MILSDAAFDIKNIMKKAEAEEEPSSQSAN